MPQKRITFTAPQLRALQSTLIVQRGRAINIFRQEYAHLLPVGADDSYDEVIRDRITDLLLRLACGVHEIDDLDRALLTIGWKYNTTMDEVKANIAQDHLGPERYLRVLRALHRKLIALGVEPDQAVLSAWDSSSSSSPAS